MSPWLSVWGLVADMAGVAIITYDVWPEYKLHRIREDIKWYHKALHSCLNENREEEPIGQTVQQMLHQMARDKVDRARAKLKLPNINNNRDLPSREEITGSENEANLALTLKMSSLETRSRPPVGFGVFLVITGFLLQLLGALPPAFVQAHLGW